jgi:hypothetical protein
MEFEVVIAANVYAVIFFHDKVLNLVGGTSILRKFTASFARSETGVITYA